MSKPILYDYFDDKANELLALYKTSSNQNASRNLGDNREGILNKFLAVVLPSKLKVTKGEVISSDNKKTGQLDTIIVRDDAPCLDFGSNHTYIAEGVFGVIEVKSNLTTDKLEEAVQTLKKVEELNVTFDFRMAVGFTLHRPLRIIFSYTGASFKTLSKFLSDNPQYIDTFDLICILDKGVLIKNNRLLSYTPEGELERTDRDFFTNSKASALGILYFYLVTYSSSFVTGDLNLVKYFTPLSAWTDYIYTARAKEVTIPKGNLPGSFNGQDTTI